MDTKNRNPILSLLERQISIIEKGLKQIPGVSGIAVVLKESKKKRDCYHIKDIIGARDDEKDHEPFLPENSRKENHIHHDVIDDAPNEESESFTLTGTNTVNAISCGAELVYDSNDPRTIQELLGNVCEIAGDNGILYVQENDTEIFQSYRDLKDDAERVLNGLRKAGLKPGDYVIFQFKDYKNFITAFWACMLGGFIPTPVSVAPVYNMESSTVKKIYNAWKLLHCPVIFTEDAFLSSIKTLDNEWKVLSINPLYTCTPDHDWYHSQPGDLVLNLLTSGSTGMPKCVQHKSTSILYRNKAGCVFDNFKRDEVTLNWMPLEHVGGIVMFHIRDVYLGCRQIICKIEHFISNPVNLLKWIEKYRVTASWGPNFAFAMVNDQENVIKQSNWDLSSMKYFLNGAETINPKVAERFMKLLTPYGFHKTAMVPAYGMSETSSGIVESRLVFEEDKTIGLQYIDKKSLGGNLRTVAPGDDDCIVFTEVGVPLPGVMFRITDKRDRVIPERRIGRIQVKGPVIMAGYYNNPEANKEVFLEDGWFHTGDLGFLDKGRLTITGREKDLIIINGVNYYNYEIESVIEECEGVEKTFSAACDIPGPGGSDSFVVFFVPKEPGKNSRFNLIPQIRRRIINILGINPDYIIPVTKDRFYKTESGKIQRVKMKKSFLNGEFENTLKQIDIYYENDNTIPDWIYKRIWIKRKLSADIPGKAGNKELTVLIFSDTEGLALEIKKILNRNSKFIFVQPGPGFSRLDPDHYVINPEAGEDYTRLIESLDKEQCTINTIIHLWNYGKYQQISNLNQLKSSQYLSAYSMLFLIHTIRMFKHGIDVIAVTSDTLPVVQENGQAFEKSTITGIIKTIPYEYTHIRCKHVDLAFHAVAENAEYIVSELNSFKDTCVVYRNGTRFVPALEKLYLPELENKTLPLKKGGLYLVTGIKSSPGKDIAGFLLEDYNAGLIIINNENNRDDDRTKESEEFIQYENRVVHYTTPLSDINALVHFISEQEQRWGTTLSGIFHFAGINELAGLAELNRKKLDDIFAVNVYETWILSQLIKDKDILFVSSSSPDVLTGGERMGGLCSAYGFAEIYSGFLNYCKKVKAFCFAWNPWKESGEFHFSGDNVHSNRKKGLNSILAGLKSDLPVLYIGMDETLSDKSGIVTHSIANEYRLIIYYSKGNGEDAYILRQELDRCLNDYLPPNIRVSKEFTCVEEIPLNDSKEPDKTLLNMLDEKPVHTVTPQNHQEVSIYKIWKSILNKDHIGVYDNFFELGGHSLKATQAVSAIRKELNAEISITDLFMNPTIKELAELVNKRIVKEPEKNDLKVTKREYGKIAPMSSAQKRQWFLYQLNPDNPFYINTIAIKLKGELNIHALSGSIQAIIDRHEILRTTFDTINDTPSQIIHDTFKINIPFIDLSTDNSGDINGKIADIKMNEAKKPFNLITGPVIRAMLIFINSDEHILLFSIHHMVSDGWSAGLFVQEISSFYRKIETNKKDEIGKPALQYTDFVLWQEEWLKSEKYKEQLAYWKETLAGEIPVLDLHPDFPRPPVQSNRGKCLALVLRPSVIQIVTTISRDEGVSLFMTLLAAFIILLAKYSSLYDIILGTMIANRNREEIETLIGVFINTLVLRVKVSPSQSFREIVKTVKESTLSAYENQDVPFEKLVDELKIPRDLSRHPVFQVLFVMQNTPFKEITIDRITTEIDIVNTETSAFDLSVQIFEETDTLKILFGYNTDLFSEYTISHLMERYSLIIDTVGQNPDILFSGIDMLTVADKENILGKWNSTYTEYPKTTCVHRLFENRVKEHPGHIALVYGNETVTYHELNTKANKLARLLVRKGVQPEDIVPVVADESIAMIVALLGVMKAGGAYLPIDPAYPEERIRYMTANSRSRILLTLNKYLKMNIVHGDVIDLEDDATYAGDGNNIDVPVQPENLAYVIYTSGSTGTPKGVMVEHRSLCNLCSWHIRAFSVTDKDRATKYAGFGFDASVWEIFPYLISGACLFIIEKEIKYDLEKLNGYFEKNKITISFLPTQVCELFMNYENRSLRYLLTGGDKLKKYKKGNYTLVNNYGPTENTVVATSIIINREYSNIPIGYPIDNTQLLILDQNSNPVPCGIPGEICICGDSLARGYLNSPDLTAEKFLPAPFFPGKKMYKTGDLGRWLPDGSIEFLGRMDSQVSIRGHRIESGEIENILIRHDDVDNAVVISRQDNNGNAYLCGYIIGKKKCNCDDMMDYLAEYLPDYMIPSCIMQLDRLPLTLNGKVDIKALPEPDVKVLHAAEYRAPRNRIERDLVIIWQNVLGLEKIGIDDNFFTLGGDSIKAIQLVSAMRKFNYKIQVSDVVNSQTISDLSKYVKEITVTIDQSAAKGKVKSSPIVKWFTAQGFSDESHWNQTVTLFNKNGFDRNAVESAMTKLIEHHDSLRLVLAGNTDELYYLPLEKVSVTIPVVNITDVTHIKERIQEENLKIQSGFAIHEGPLVNALIIKTANGDHLIIAIHHLCVDGISWRIVLEDFEYAYTAALKQKHCELPPKTHSFKEWASELYKEEILARMKKELPFWKNICLEDPDAVKETDYWQVRHTRTMAETYTFSLGKNDTAVLLTNANRAYNTGIHDILLSALSLSIKKWKNKNRCIINLEAHGREPVSGYIDISRTAGWFTSLYPFLLEVYDEYDLGLHIRKTKEALRNVPGGGIGFGILKYLADLDESDKTILAVAPEIWFNYLGQFNTRQGDGSIRLSEYNQWFGIGKSNELECYLSLVCMVEDSALKFFVQFDTSKYTKEAIMEFMNIFNERIMVIKGHCLQVEGTVTTPSDYTDSSMSFEDLDFITRELES
ncbi:MAG: amino acid adenylation domain-containing protein [Spirochaetales bacterium]|nr:amino acid adenylation domain-containing protein [Spirochaetales bacterium]